MTKKFLLLITLFASILAVSNAQNVTKEMLTSGKWLNKSHGYYPTPIATDTARAEIQPTSRYKYLTFKADDHFYMDSAKVRYTGTYEINGNLIILTFAPQNLTNLSRNTDPNDRTGGYKGGKVVLDLGTREGKINHEGQLDFNGMTFTSYSDAVAGIINFYEFSGFANTSRGNLIMIFVGLIFIFLAIRFDYEPLLLIPIGTGILLGNIPMFQAIDFNLQVGVYEPGSVLNILYQGVVQGWYPPLIFLGIGAMTDFSSLISNPRLMLLGAAAQIGIFATFIGALLLGFAPSEAGAIGIIGGADGPTAIFLSSKLANGTNIIGYDAEGMAILVKNLIGPIAIAAYSYMALVPVIQPPVILLLTTKKERLIRMRSPRTVSKLEKILFPIIGLLVTLFIAPSALPLLGMLFFGNLLKESGVTKRLATTASNALIDTITMLLGITVGASTQADVFLTKDSILIFILGAASFIVATASGVVFAKIMNWFSSKENPINPMIGAAGVSAVPDSARVVQSMGLKADPTNHLLMHAMAPNVSGVIGSAVAAGILLSFLL
jgi:oxaloacetate decarboxylase beta subunit